MNKLGKQLLVSAVSSWTLIQGAQLIMMTEIWTSHLSHCFTLFTHFFFSFK